MSSIPSTTRKCRARHEFTKIHSGVCLLIVMFLMTSSLENLTPSTILVVHAFSPSSFHSDSLSESTSSHISLGKHEIRKPRGTLKRLATTDIIISVPAAPVSVPNRASESSTVSIEKSVKQQIQEKKDALQNAAAEAFKRKEELRSQWMSYKNDIRGQKAFLKYKAQQTLLDLQRKEEEKKSKEHKDHQTQMEKAPEAGPEPVWIDLNRQRRNSMRYRQKR